tara:strand:- start:578 stop:1459 length:882 start_codon:yes stop_codon:yes gene_type:complete
MKFVIFGSGYHGRLALRKLISKSKKSKVFFIDNDKTKHDKTCLGKKIFPVSKIKTLNFDKLVMCGRNIQEQISQLKEYNIPLKKFVFFGKSEIRPNKSLINKRSKIFYVMLKELITKFQSMNIDYCMDYSGLLPLMRNEKYGELSDIEISFNLNHLDKVIKVLNKNKTFQTKYIFIKKKKFILKRGKKFNRIVLFSKYRNKDIELPHIDLIIKKINKNNTFNMFLENKFSIKYWRDKTYKSSKGVNLKIPKYYEEYLNKLYGKNWRKKTEHWGLKNGSFKSLTKNNYFKILKT